LNTKVGREVDVARVGIVNDLYGVFMRIEFVAGRDGERRRLVRGRDSSGQDETTIRGDGVLLQLDGDGTARRVGPLDGERVSSCHIQCALTCRNTDGIVLRGSDGCAESSEGSEEEPHSRGQTEGGDAIQREEMRS